MFFDFAHYEKYKMMIFNLILVFLCAKSTPSLIPIASI